jgi:hypothetical protein
LRAMKRSARSGTTGKVGKWISNDALNRIWPDG